MLTPGSSSNEAMPQTAEHVRKGLPIGGLRQVPLAESRGAPVGHVGLWPGGPGVLDINGRRDAGRQRLVDARPIERVAGHQADRCTDTTL